MATVATALHQRDDGAYVGFLTDEDPARVRHAYPGSTWDRLVQVKARDDPTSLSHHNRNIPTTINKPGSDGRPPASRQRPGGRAIRRRSSSLSFSLVRDRSAGFMIGCDACNRRFAVWSEN